MTAWKVYQKYEEKGSWRPLQEKGDWNPATREGDRA